MEYDLRLKAESRRLFWMMGFSTKVDVPLRTLIARRPNDTKARSEYELFTDLDVLGVQVSPDLRVSTMIADCKTSSAGATSRMFWIKGVADFFGANDAYMVRTADVPGAARQLAVKLGVGVLTSTDLALVQSHYADDWDNNLGISFLFDEQSIAKYRKGFTTLHKRLQPLREYQEFDYWIYEEHRNLTQVVAHLSDAAKLLDPEIPMHRSLFFESAWLYSLALARASHHARRTHVAELDTALKEYMFGGQLGLREKKRLASMLRSAAGRDSSDADAGVFPPYYFGLLELTSRFLRRPSHVSAVLRHAEWAAEVQVTSSTQTAAVALAETFDRLSAKLLSDVCSFLVTAAGLNSEFRTLARRLLAPEVGQIGVERLNAGTTDRRSSLGLQTERSTHGQNPLPLDSSRTGDDTATQ